MTYQIAKITITPLKLFISMLMTARFILQFIVIFKTFKIAEVHAINLTD